MLRSIPTASVAAGLFNTALVSAGSLTSGPAVENLAKPFKRTSAPSPRPSSLSFDFALRLFLYWGVISVLRKMRADEDIFRH